MSIISGLFRSRDKPTNSTSGSAYRFFFGGSTSGKDQYFCAEHHEAIISHEDLNWPHTF